VDAVRQMKIGLSLCKRPTLVIEGVSATGGELGLLLVMIELALAMLAFRLRAVSQ